MLCREGTYYFRRATPKDLRYLIGQREITKSLATSDARIARKVALEMSDQLDELFSRIRNGRKLLSTHEVDTVAQHVTRSKTKRLMVEALEEFKDRKKEEEEWEAYHAREYGQQTLEDLRLSRLESAEPDTDALLQEHGVSLDRASAIYKQLCRASLLGLANFYKNAEIIVRGDLENPALNPDQLPTRVSHTIEINDLSEGLTFVDAIDKYLSDHQSTWSTKQFNSLEARLNYFLDYAFEKDGLPNSERLLSSITTAESRAYKEHLQLTPANAKKKYADLSPSASVKAASRDNANLLSVTSQNNYLQSLSTLYKYAAQELDYQGDNPFKGRSNSKAAKKIQREQRNSFSRDQLQRLFRSPIYTGCKSLSSCYKKGSLIPKESHKYWVPLIGLYTGMRMQEILQLYIVDIYKTNEIWIFDLNENHEDQRLKTPQSKRLVPLHRDLLNLGFIEFVETRRSERLFTDAKASSDGTYSSTFSKWFSRYLEKVELKTDKTSFHSFRHNLKDFFRQTGESDELAENFMGRTTGTTGEAYGSGFSVQRLNEAIQKISFEDYISLE